MTNYFGITEEGNIVLIGAFSSFDEAEDVAGNYGDHEDEDIVYFGTREHFNTCFDKLEQEQV